MEEKICQELDDAVAAMEKLNDENETKTEMCENLRAAHDEQLSTIKDATLEIEKQAQEPNAKAEELSVMKQVYEEAKSNLQEKEFTLEQLRLAHDKLQEDNGEKLRIMEGRNKELVSALDEAYKRIQEKEHQIQSLKDEMECRKALVSTACKDPETEQNAPAQDQKQGDNDLLLELDEENAEIKSQLQCKIEQFDENKKEWEEEKRMLIDEISSLQAKLDFQTKISESLQHNMQLCNESLAQEETRRKQLEGQISGSKECNENVSGECQESNTKRDEEIESLRNLLSTNETLFKEAESRRECLERENHGLRISLKEYQESHIHESDPISSHVELPSKNQQMQIELDSCYSSMVELKLRNEELYVMLALYKSGLSDAYSNLSQPKVDMEPDTKEVEVKSVLIEELDQRNTSSTKAHSEFEQEREIPESLVVNELLYTSPTKSHSEFEQECEIPESVVVNELLNTSPTKSHSEFEHKYLMTLKELEDCIDMLEESSLQQLQLKEEAMQMENALKEDLRKIRDAFDNISSELVEKIQDAIEIELELERWIAVAEHLQHCLDESVKVRREMEVSLLAQVETEHTLKQENEHLVHLVEEKDRRADGLHREIVSLNQELLKSETETATLARMVTHSELEMEKEKFLQILEEKNKNIHKHRQKLYSLEQEVMRRELDGMRRELENAIFVQMQTEQSLEQERDRLLKVVEKKDGIIEYLWLQIMEHDLISLINVSTSALHEEKTVDEETENVLMAQYLDELETQVKNTVIMGLEEEISSLKLTLESNDKTMACTKHQVEQLEAALEAKQLEMATLRSRLGTSSENNQDMTSLSSEKTDLSGVVEQVNGLCNSDKGVMRSFGSGDQKLMGLKVGVKFYDSDRENGNSPHSLSAKSGETTPDRRSPLIEVSN